MENTEVGGIKIYFDANGKPFVNLYIEACAKSIRLIHDMWGLKVPQNCKVFIATSWLKFSFLPVSWLEKIIYAIGLLFLYRKSVRIWEISGGFTSRLHPISVIKAPSLVASTDKKVGERIFTQEPIAEKNVETNICHELVHAFSVHLNLPTWLHEGIAMYTVDKYMGKATVKHETVELLETQPNKPEPSNSHNLLSLDNDAAVYNYVRGYWITRYLEQDYPGLIRNLLDRHQTGHQIDEQIGNRINISPDAFWNEIDKRVVARFKMENAEV